MSQLGKTLLTKRGWASEQRGVSQNGHNRASTLMIGRPSGEKCWLENFQFFFEPISA
jgi:hypothetical protein